MTLQEIIDLMQYGAIGVLIILLGLIKIPHVNINLWGILARSVGRAINKDVLDKVERLTMDFEHHLDIEEKEKIRQARQRILRFNDEILFQKRHSKEHFDEILEDIDIYEKYCASHPDYKNNKAVFAISTIKSVYDDCLRTHSFLVYNAKKKEENKK